MLVRGEATTGPVLAVLLLACGPAAAKPGPPTTVAPAASTAKPVATAPDPTAGTSTRPRAAFVCRIDVEIREAERARGSAASDRSPDDAHDLAWRRACDDLRARSGLDCDDDARVRVVKRSSSTRMSGSGDASTAHYEQVFELVGFRLARGEAGSDVGLAEACHAATENACQASLGTPCPEGRVHVLKADGDGTDRPPPGPPPRRTI